jgi:methyl coenzyme M reductase subunit C-like uncharacterized protein (methanogenesis marker protein 7)
MDDIVQEFRAFYVQRATSGLDVEFGVPLLQDPTKASDKELRRLIIQMPLERFRIQILSPFLKLHLRHKSCTLPIVLAPPLL